MHHIFDFITTVWPYIYHGFEWFFLTVIVKYIFVHWVADITLKGMKRFLVRTKSQAVYWLHFRDKAMNRGHQSDTPETCLDGMCKDLQ